MSFVYYAVLVVVSLSSVVFGLEWLSEPPPAWKPVAVATVKQPVDQPAKPPVKQATSQTAQPVPPTKAASTTAPATTAQQDAARPQATAAATPDTSTAGDTQQTAMAPANTDSAAVAPVPSSSDIMAPEPGAEPAAAAAPRCDVQACSAAYFTFDPSDCTYQPIDGPRRLCTKGTPPAASTAQDSGQETTTDTAAAPQVSNKCDIDACKKAYFTFDPADCTYQPTNGPRRLCTRGTPPAPDTAQAPEQDSKPDEPQVAVNADTPPDASAAETPAQETATDTAAAPQVSNKCDIDACKKAYFTFDPADCTYQPTDGPRRLCTKGTPPAPDTAQAPAQDSKPDEPQVAVNADTPPDASAAQAPGQESDTAIAAVPPVSNKCDIDACKKAYFTFDPADCTYQPTDGPRRLCTRGTPPAPDTAQVPAQDTKPNEPQVAVNADTSPDANTAQTPAPDTAQAPAQDSKPDEPQVSVNVDLPQVDVKVDPPQVSVNVDTPPDPNAAQTPAPDTETAATPPVSNKCDIDACKKAYFTFDPADCTYQPTNGPRRLCTKGTPPRPDTAQDTKPDEADADARASVGAAPAESASADTEQQVSNKCDIDACKKAYFTFDPADCTYQPTNGPRRLCTRGTPPAPQAATPRAAPDRPVPPGLVPSAR